MAFSGNIGGNNNRGFGGNAAAD